MSESPTDKTKRIFIQHLMSYEWTFQFSLFYQSYDQSKDAIEHGKKYRKWLSRKHKSPILWRLAVRNNQTSFLLNAPENCKTVQMPYHVFFFTTKPNTELLLDKFMDINQVSMKEKHRKLTPQKIESYAQSVNQQKPHNLKGLFFEKKLTDLVY